MSRLRMLRLDDVTLKGEYERFPRNIRWLEWSPKDLNCLPCCLHLDNMVVLDLSSSSIVRLWDGQKVLHQLKVLDLRYCRSLVVCPDFKSMPHLEILNLKECEMVSELHPSIGLLKNLCELCLSSCTSLKELPEQIYGLTSLQKLDLSCCKIIALPLQYGDSKSSEQLGKLQVLLLSECRKLTKCPDFGKMPNLKRLSFKDCEKMNDIDPSIGHLKRLIRLDLGSCSSLEELPQEIGQLTSLEELDLSSCSQISSLLESMGHLKQLKSLDLSSCSSLQEVPKSIMSLDQLETLSIYRCDLLKSLPPLPPSLIRLDANSCSLLESVGDISNVKGLQNLDLGGCEKLLDVAGIEQLKFLEYLNLAYCRSLCVSVVGRMKEACYPKFHNSSNSKKVERIAATTANVKDLDRLKKLYLYGCESLTKSPHFTSNMTHLEYLELGGLVNMTEVDPSIRHLKALTSLSLINSKSLKELPEEVCQLTSLEHLGLSDCCQITALPESVGHLKQLRWLELENCSSLREVPESICLLPHLERLNAWGCTSLASLPNSLGNLKSLRELHLGGTTIEQLPDSIIQLENLYDLSVPNCNNLEFLPRLPPSVTSLHARYCGKLLDILGIEQLTGLRTFRLERCTSLENSFLERLESIFFNNEGMKYFSIPGRLIEGGSSYPQSLSFPFPRHLKDFQRTTLYLYVDESSFNNIRSVLDSQQEEETIVRLVFSINHVQFLFSASFGYKYHGHIPTASFSYEEVMKKVADVDRTGMMKIHLSIDDCTLLHGDFFSFDPDALYSFDRGQNAVRVVFH
ncbi:unnamed protein product [Victoria cruziana]